MNQKGFVPILIVILIVLTTVIGGYLIYSGRINLFQKQTQITEETESWKTYQMGDAILKIPPDYTVEVTDIKKIPYGPNILMTDRSEMAVSFIPPKWSTLTGEKRLGQIAVEKLALELEESIDTEDYIRNVLFKNGFRASNEIVSLNKEQLGDVVVYRVLAKGSYGIPPTEDHPNKTSQTFVRLGNKLFYFIFQHGGGPTPKPVYEYPNYWVYEQMISSIKLVQFQTTQVDKTANWKTYTNAKYKYEVKYPSDWNIVDTHTDEQVTFGARGSVESKPPLVSIHVFETSKFKTEDIQNYTPFDYRTLEKGGYTFFFVASTYQIGGGASPETEEQGKEVLGKIYTTFKFTN